MRVDLLDGKAKFQVSVVGETDGITYLGVFTVKGSLSPLDTLKYDKRYRDLLGKELQYASEHAARIAFTLATLSVRIIESPEWWKNKEIDGGHLDENVLFEVLGKAIDAEEEFRKQRKEQSDMLKNSLNGKLISGEIAKDE